jgi:hypothetical protein
VIINCFIGSKGYEGKRYPAAKMLCTISKNIAHPKWSELKSQFFADGNYSTFSR